MAGAGLALALLAGVMVEMVVEDHSRASLVWMTGLATVLAGAVGSIVVISVRDADLLWETRKAAAIAAGDAEIAVRRADECRSDDAHSRELLQRLQAATFDALRDPFLADRLARGPRDENGLLVLLDQIDEHLATRPGEYRLVPRRRVGEGERSLGPQAERAQFLARLRRRVRAR